MRADDAYHIFVTRGMGSKRCPNCKKNNNIHYQMDGEIKLTKEKEVNNDVTI